MDKPRKPRTSAPGMADESFRKLSALFPGAVTEALDGSGAAVRAIDEDALEQEINARVVVGTEERYRFTWPGKRKSALLANAPPSAALRPCRGESVDFDGTGNLCIEGDNLHALKLLRGAYLGRVRMAYIDPPYNTGNGFVYGDDFSEGAAGPPRRDGPSGGQGDRAMQDGDGGGRLHAGWLNMVYPRLRVARDLLADDGAIFISIDDNEVENLKKVCSEVFGGENFVACVVWKRKRGRDNSARWFSKAHEYALLYAKNKNMFKTNRLVLDDETKAAYRNPDGDPRGNWRMLACWSRGTQGGVSYDFTTKDGQYFPKRLWLFSKQSLTALDRDGKLVIRGDNIYRKMFITENRGKIPETLWDSVSNAANAADEIKRLFDGSIVFETPKPIPYITEMLRVASYPHDVILDFFSGPATTAHAVMQLNAEDGGGRRSIMVQAPERCPPDSEAARAGFRNICEIGKERIRRAGAKIRAGGPTAARDPDVGFRVLKLDPPDTGGARHPPGMHAGARAGPGGNAGNAKEGGRTRTCCSRRCSSSAYPSRPGYPGTAAC